MSNAAIVAQCSAWVVIQLGPGP